MNHYLPTTARGAALILLTALPLAAQELPTGGAAGPTGELPAASEAEAKSGGWLMSSPLVDVGWPELKMPKVNWKPFSATDPDAAPKPNPITRVTQATQGAFQRGRTAWNGAVEKMKIGPFRSSKPDQPADAEPSFFAKMFGGQQEPQRSETVAEFIGQDRPTMR
ncbi:hypothetical protein Pla123a_16010 [Posidoniimonas polymericola]|uniref:Uncharacterized protein n=1 Tax=Posidoniimonas polymericola TaxID=2528002 RepID=A0A5C5YS90_9BACT|nr:hypothetical protein [Posidoniimonas polymericola]TWT77805.1 hypothetical protein Pla123a_16010 [Posidoniimonas polymericola]